MKYKLQLSIFSFLTQYNGKIILGKSMGKNSYKQMGKLSWSNAERFLYLNHGFALERFST